MAAAAWLPPGPTWKAGTEPMLSSPGVDSKAVVPTPRPFFLVWQREIGFEPSWVTFYSNLCTAILPCRAVGLTD